MNSIPSNTCILHNFTAVLSLLTDRRRPEYVVLPVDCFSFHATSLMVFLCVVLLFTYYHHYDQLWKWASNSSFKEVHLFKPGTLWMVLWSTHRYILSFICEEKNEIGRSYVLLLLLLFPHQRHEWLPWLLTRISFLTLDRLQFHVKGVFDSPNDIDEEKS